MKLEQSLVAYGLKVPYGPKTQTFDPLPGPSLAAEEAFLARMAVADERCWHFERLRPGNRLPYVLQSDEGVITEPAFDEWRRLAHEYRQLQFIHQNGHDWSQLIRLSRHDRLCELERQLRSTTPHWSP